MKQCFACLAALCLVLPLCWVPVQAEAPTISATAAVVYNPDSGEYLYTQNETQTLPMASTTKIMTTLITLEQPNLEEVFTVDSQAIQVEGSSMGLTEGATVSLLDLAKGMLSVSGNDAANAAAVRIAGSLPRFAELMNQKAAQLGLENTHFVTPSGLHHDDHYTTAADLAKLAAAALDNELFAQICSSATITATVSGQQRTYQNSNKLLSAYPGCIGVKTGFTDEAGRCLVSAARQDGVTLIAVTLHDPNDWADHTQLLNYGFSQVEPVQLTTAGENVTLKVTGGEAESISAVPGEEIWRGITAQQLSQVEQRVYADPFLYAPVSVGEEVGRIEYYLNGRKLAQAPLLAAEATERAQVAEEPAQPQSWWEKFLSWLGLG